MPTMYTRTQRVGEVFLAVCVCFLLQSAAEELGEKLRADLRSLSSAYGKALESLAEQNWSDSVRFLELSVRLHRVLTRSVAFCSQNCGVSSANEPGPPRRITDDHRVYWSVLQRASCVKKCRARFPELEFSPPGKEILRDFEMRVPYKYLYVAYEQLNETQKAASAAHTYLQRNPGDAAMVASLGRYRNAVKLEEEPEDLEERPYERIFLQAVFLFNGGEFSRSISLMEEALLGYLQEFELSSAACEGILDTPQHSDMHSSIADIYTEVLRCKADCEDALRPNVGGFFVDKFLATMYHYLQFSYYKMEDVASAVPCAASYLLFDPEDEVMKDNMKVYLTNQEDWGLQQHHYKARSEAVDYFNRISSQKAMLEFSQLHLQSDDEVGEVNGPDGEFSGAAGREEPLIADWDPPIRSRGDMGVPED